MEQMVECRTYKLEKKKVKSYKVQGIGRRIYLGVGSLENADKI